MPKYVTITTKEVVTSTFVVAIDDNEPTDKAEQLLFDLEQTGRISFGDGKLYLGVSVDCVSDVKPAYADVLTASDLD